MAVSISVVSVRAPRWDHRIYLAVVFFQPANEIITVYLSPELLIIDVWLFVGAGEIIYRQHVGVACFVEFLNHAGTDKARCAGDHDHERRVFLCSGVFCSGVFVLVF